MYLTFWCLVRAQDSYVAKPYLTLYSDMYELRRPVTCIDNEPEVELAS